MLEHGIPEVDAISRISVEKIDRCGILFYIVKSYAYILSKLFIHPSNIHRKSTISSREYFATYVLVFRLQPYSTVPLTQITSTLEPKCLFTNWEFFLSRDLPSVTLCLSQNGFCLVTVPPWLKDSWTDKEPGPITCTQSVTSTVSVKQKDQNCGLKAETLKL